MAKTPTAPRNGAAMILTAAPVYRTGVVVPVEEVALVVVALPTAPDEETWQ